MKKSFLFLVLLFFATLFSQGANWYVDPSGTDNGSHGTTSGTGAFKTIGYALGFGTLNNGDVIKVGAGTYIESNLIVSKALLYKVWVPPEMMLSSYLQPKTII